MDILGSVKRLVSAIFKQSSGFTTTLSATNKGADLIQYLPEHAGTLATGPTTTVDESIARYNSTAGDLQAGYTGGKEPLISDAGVVNIQNDTDATNSTTAALKTAGGIATAKNVYVGGGSILVEDPGAGTNKASITAPTLGGDVVITLPSATDTLVGRATTDTLTNKTLSDTTTTFGAVGALTKALKFLLSAATAGKTMTISSAHTDDRTLSLPDANDTLVGKATTDTLTNKTLSDTTTTIGAVGALTKALKFLLSGATAGKTMTISSSHTDDRTLSLPDRTGTLVTGPTSTNDLELARYDSTAGILKAKATTGATMSDTGVITINNTTDANATTGALVIEGGICSKKNIALPAQKEVRFYDSDSTNYIGLKSPATVAADKTFILPNADGSAGQVLKTDGSANLGWMDAVSNPYSTASAISLTSTDAGISLTTGSGTGDDFTVNTTSLVVEGDTGRVGIGTTSPQTNLDVRDSTGSGRQDIAWFLKGPNATGSAASISLGSTQTLAGYITGIQTSFNTGDLALGTQTSGSYSEKIRILSDGNVGIGTTSPSMALDVRKDVASNYATRIWNNDTSGNGLIVRAGNTSSQYSLIVTNYSTATTGLAVLGDGKVGIGTDAPTVALDVVGAIKASTTVTATLGDITATDGDIVVSTAAHGIKFTNGGNTVLSHYEEGTFTVYCVDGTNKSAGVTATYVRIGKLVTITIPEVVVTSTATGRVLTTTNDAGTYTWRAGLYPASGTAYATYSRESGSSFASAVLGISSTQTVTLYSDLAGNAFNGNNEAKGLMTCTISYIIN